MEATQQNEIKEQKNSPSVSEDVGTAPKKCTTCKLVLIFAFVVLVLVSVFVFYVRYQAAPPQIPIQTTKALTGAEIDQRLLDLKGTQVYPSANPYAQPHLNTGVKK